MIKVYAQVLKPTTGGRHRICDKAEALFVNDEEGAAAAIRCAVDKISKMKVGDDRLLTLTVGPTNDY